MFRSRERKGNLAPWNGSWLVSSLPLRLSSLWPYEVQANIFRNLIFSLNGTLFPCPQLVNTYFVMSLLVSFSDWDVRGDSHINAHADPRPGWLSARGETFKELGQFLLVAHSTSFGRTVPPMVLSTNTSFSFQFSPPLPCFPRPSHAHTPISC